MDGSWSKEAPETVLESVRMVVNLLAEGEWQALANLTDGRRLSAADIESAIRDYGRNVTPFPEEALRDLDVEQVRPRGAEAVASGGRVFVVDVPLWIEEEGQSDLTLELRIKEGADGLHDIEIDDIHVL